MRFSAKNANFVFRKRNEHEDEKGDSGRDAQPQPGPDRSGAAGGGRGYYDRYLSLPGFRAAKIGVCYRHQLTDELPVEPHDIRMDTVVAG